MPRLRSKAELGAVKVSVLLGAPHGSLFSGYGGLDQAVEAATGCRTVWVSDIDEGACAILAYRYPDAPNLGDISEVRWTPPCPLCARDTQVRWAGDSQAYEYVCTGCGGEFPERLRWDDPERTYPDPARVLSGGFPCQDVSTAGKRRGLVTGTRSGLWAMFARGINAMRPDLVVIENVRGLLSADGEAWHDALVAANDEAEHLRRTLVVIHQRMNRHREDREYVHRKKAEAHRIVRRHKRALGVVKRERGLVQRAIGTVLGDLAELGYDAQWVGLRAADVGAPHGRYRIFITAHPAGHPPSVERQRGGSVRDERAGDAGPVGVAGGRAAEDADSATRGERGEPAPGQAAGGRAWPDAGRRSGAGDAEALADPSGERYGGGEDRGGLGPLDGSAEGEARERERARRESGNRGGQAAADLILPTPRATRGGSSTETVYLLDGADRASQLLPTPTVQDASNVGGPSQQQRNTPPLNAVAPLLPTPSAADGLGGHERRGGDRGDELLLSGVAKEIAAAAEPDDVPLLPTPSAANGNGGGRHGSPGHQMPLPGAVKSLLPTPRTGDNRNSRTALTGANADQHGRTAAGSASGLGLEQALEVARGEVPRELLLPTPTTQPTTGNGHARDLGTETKALLPTPRATDGTKGGPNQHGSSGDLMLPSAVQGLLPTPRSQNGEERNQNIWERPEDQPQNLENALARVPEVAELLPTATPEPQGSRWGNYQAAVDRWEAVTRPAPPPTTEGRNGGQRLNPEFVEWMMGLPLGWVTDPAIGLTRNQQLKALGNGVVPQQGYLGILHLLDVAALVPN